MLRDRVLPDPEDRGEVDLHGKDSIPLRERDIDALAARRVEDGRPGLLL